MKGAKDAFKCSLILACEGVFTPIFHDAIVLFLRNSKVSTTQGCILVVRTEMQYVLYQRKIELRTRSMSHLLSSVDPVLYCDTNGPTHAPAVLSLVSSAASVFASSLGPLRIVRCIVLLHRVVRIHCLCTTAAAALFASFIMLYSVL